MGGAEKRLSGKSAAGFTLLEVLVTLTIMGFILLVTFEVFRVGLSAWDRGEATREGYQKMRIASQLISSQVKSLVPYKVKTQKAEGDFLAFEGKPRSLKFVSTMSLKTRNPSGLVYVAYEFQTLGDSGRLMHYEGRVVNKNFMDGEPPEEGKISFFEDLADVRCEYYREEDPTNNRDAEWLEEWNTKEEKELPKALRMILFPQKRGGRGEEPPIIILASLPSNRFEQVLTGPGTRTSATTPGAAGPGAAGPGMMPGRR